MSTKRKFHIPDAAEDAALTKAAESDTDNPPLTDAQLKRMRPAREALPAMVGEAAAEVLLKRPGRPTKPIDQHKVRTTIRLDPDLIDAFKGTGDGWQSRMNDALREWASSHGMFRGR
ncbi:BrnA antitoxin family protein [Paraburkholderia bryophila]|uniref:Uncharacterized protein (DUF4415 family) n=1 Tax=Paraburkholderia bryophila TaxID=420952 RepID=A0A329B5R7_9BURK|nr:BrnA antitoxin family protein [Paraburkholderia bryophila]RAS16048.1 uncharacterized protein (DUF4415 family) [Paraburkholderia bryophila]